MIGMEDQRRAQKLVEWNDRAEGRRTPSQRQQALDYAIHLAAPGTPAADVIAAAEAYELYLSGQTAPAADRRPDQGDA